jgi:hypothetical protein
MDSLTAADAGSIWLPGPAFLRPAEEAQARGLLARPPVVGQFQIDPLPTWSPENFVCRPPGGQRRRAREKWNPPWLLSFKSKAKNALSEREKGTAKRWVRVRFTAGLKPRFRGRRKVSRGYQPHAVVVHHTTQPWINQKRL